VKPGDTFRIGGVGPVLTVRRVFSAFADEQHPAHVQYGHAGYTFWISEDLCVPVEETANVG
jgi:hypothetical protein